MDSNQAATSKLLTSSENIYIPSKRHMMDECDGQDKGKKMLLY